MVDDTTLFISALSIREIHLGIEKRRKKAPKIAAGLQAKLNAIQAAYGSRILPVDKTVAEMWARMIADKDKHRDDLALAATAKVHGLAMVTRNTKDFEGRGLPLLNPFKSPPEAIPA
jgi:predicted nucleic acid-binding protein